MNINQNALIRGWIQGVGWDVLGELYLDEAERTDTIRAVRQLREYASRACIFKNVWRMGFAS